MVAGPAYAATSSKAWLRRRQSRKVAGETRLPLGLVHPLYPAVSEPVDSDQPRPVGEGDAGGVGYWPAGRPEAEERNYAEQGGANRHQHVGSETGSAVPPLALGADERPQQRRKGEVGRPASMMEGWKDG